MLTKKAAVVETGKGWAVILLPGGEYKRIKTNRYLEVGELYRYRNYAGSKYLAAAAIFLTILLGSIDYYTVQAYAEVSSLELGLNRWGRVVSVQAQNDEGQRIISQVQIKNEPLENAVQKISRIVEQEKPNGTGLAGKTPVKIHTKGKAKPELEQKLLEKIEQKQEKDSPVKNQNEVKKELKNERKLQHLKVNNSNDRQESLEKSQPAGNNTEDGSRLNDQDLEKQTGKARLKDEKLTVDKAESSTPTEVVEPEISGEKEDKGKNDKNSNNKTNRDNKNQGNNHKNDNNCKNQGEG